MRRGFTVIEVLVTLLVIASLSAILLPGILAKISDANSTSLEGNLRAINAAILQYRENTGRFPSQLIELTTRPTDGVSLDDCGAVVASTTAAKWDGPYLAATVTATGIESGDAVIGGTLQRNPLTATASAMSGVLQISVSNVTGAVANDVESLFDTGNDLDHGTVTWIPTAGIIGTLTYSIPIRGC